MTSQVEQIECRWQSGKDLSPVASSMDAKNTNHWFNEIRGNARADKPNPLYGAPDASVVYRVLGQQVAAVILRRWDISALPIGNESNRRPLVSRVLLGHPSLLSADGAMALCVAAASHVIVPRPGRIQLGTKLPPIEHRQLLALGDQAAEELDAEARKIAGLDRLIAAALRHPDAALAMQLPPEQIGEPSSGPQVPLLWGLWRCTDQLLAADGQAADQRRWSFSTFEPPLGNTDTKQLPRIVFRALRETGAPAISREEVGVFLNPQPGDPAGDPDFYDELAAMLRRAYETVGGLELATWLRDASRRPTLADRLSQASETLTELFSPRQAGVGKAPPVPPVPAVTEVAEVARPAISPEDPPVQTREPAKHPAGLEVSHQIGSLLTLLSADPPAPEFVQTLHTLMRLPGLSEDSRAQARAQLAECGWLLEALIQHDRWHVENALESIFKLTVIPDLPNQQVRDDLTTWVLDNFAPVAVVRALYASADSDEGATDLLYQTLLPALGERWLWEHSIFPALQSTAAIMQMPAESQTPSPAPLEQASHELVPATDQHEQRAGWFRRLSQRILQWRRPEGTAR